MIAANYRVVSVRVIELGNGVYRMEGFQMVPDREVSGVRLGSSAAALVDDVIACALTVGVVDHDPWIDAHARADEGATVIYVRIA